MKRNSPVTQLPSIIEESDNDLEEEIQIDGPTGYGGCLCKDRVGEKEWVRSHHHDTASHVFLIIPSCC